MGYKKELQANNLDLDNVLNRIKTLPRLVGDSMLNIHYGDTAPEDTSMLWCKCAKPDSVIISSDISQMPMTIDTVKSITASPPKYARVGTTLYLVDTSKLYKYDLSTEEFTALETLSTDNIRYGCMCAVGTNVYLIGGYNLKSIYVFDTVSEVLTLLDVQLPVALRDSVAGVIGTTIYLFGGCQGGGGGYNSIYEFNTETNEIIQLSATLSYKQSETGCVVYGTKIYLFGGYYYNSSTNKGYVSTIAEFDTETKTIRYVTALPRSMSNIGCCLVGTKVYLFGGYAGSSGSTYDTIYVFDIETEQITTLDIILPVKGKEIVTALNGSDIYLLYNNAVYRFALQTDLHYGTLQILPSLSKNKFNLLGATPRVEIGVSNILLGNSDNLGEFVDAYLYKDEAWVQI